MNVIRNQTNKKYPPPKHATEYIFILEKGKWILWFTEEKERGEYLDSKKKYCLPFSKRKKKKQRIWPAFPVNNKCCPYSNHQPLQHPMLEQPEGNLDGEIKDTGATSCGKMGLSTWIPQTRQMEEIISGEYEQHPGRGWAKKWHIDQKAEKVKDTKKGVILRTCGRKAWSENLPKFCGPSER